MQAYKTYEHNTRAHESRSPALVELPTVHMFWHGGPLTRVERLCIKSFVATGHDVQLHVYDELWGVPRGVRLADARRVIPESYLFRHRKTGSWALFADWFRYCVLYKYGGFWADTDVVCLRPLVYAHDEVYAWENEHYINNAVLGLPAGHPLAAWMARCCERPNNILPYDDARSRLRKLRRRWLQGDRRENLRWGEYGPMGFTQAAHHFGLAEKALQSDEFYPNRWQNWRRVFSGEPYAWDAALSRSKALHLCNDMMRREPGFDKNASFPEASLFEQLCQRWLDEDARS